MKNHIHTHRKIYGFVAAVISVGIALIYLVFTPTEVNGATGVQKIILMYGHSICWFLLAAASFLWMSVKTVRWSVWLLYAALLVYGAFIVTLLIV